MSSSSSEEHGDYSGDEIDFGDEPSLPDASKFSYISKEKMQVDVPAKFSSSGEVTTIDGISSIPLFFSSYEHYFNPP